MQHNARRAGASGLVVALIWGINIPAMKFAVGELDPFVFNVLRLSLSALALGVLAHAETGASGDTPWLRVIAIGLLTSLLYQIVFILGLAYTTSGNTSLIIASSPLWTALIASLSGSERLRLGAWIGLALAFSGTTIVALEGGRVDLGDEHWKGNLLILCAAFMWALGTVLSRKAVQRVAPTRLAYLFTLAALPGHFALAWTRFDLDQVRSVSASAWGAVVYAGVFSTGVAYALWNFSVRRIGPSHTAIYTNLVPAIALFLSWLLLKETVTPAQLVGGGLILGGLFAMARARERR